jgi:hypothetical protein
MVLNEHRLLSVFQKGHLAVNIKAFQLKFYKQIYIEMTQLRLIDLNILSYNPGELTQTLE